MRADAARETRLRQPEPFERGRVVQPRFLRFVEAERRDAAAGLLLAECVMLGTDYPFPLGEQEPGSGIAALGLSEAEQAHLYHGTALRWLGLPASRFV